MSTTRYNHFEVFAPWGWLLVELLVSPVTPGARQENTKLFIATFCRRNDDDDDSVEVLTKPC